MIHTFYRVLKLNKSYKIQIGEHHWVVLLALNEYLI